MLSPIFSWLFLLAMCQAAWLAMALLAMPQPEMRSANRLLSTLLLVCAIIIGHAWLGSKGLYAAYPHSAMAITTLGLAVGPLLYLYLDAALCGRRLDRRALRHFVPFGLATLAMLPFYLRTAAEKLAWMQQLTGIPWYLALAAVVKLSIFMAYLHACHRLIQRVPADSVLLRGLRQLVRLWLLGALLSVLALGMELAQTDWIVSPDELATIALILFVFTTAFLAMRMPLGYRPQALPASTPPAPPQPQLKPRYANKQLSAADRDDFLARLSDCMEHEQPYRNGELKLDELASRLALTPHELSQLINDACGTNFADYLNRYRVAALKQALGDASQANASILTLALASGFNSKSAMNRVFKQQTGMTPGEYRCHAETAALSTAE